MVHLLPIIIVFFLLPSALSQPLCPPSPLSLNFQYSWDSTTDPEYPALPKLIIEIGFTPLLCVTHVANLTLWSPGQRANKYVESLMRTRTTRRLRRYLRKQKQQGTVFHFVEHDQMSPTNASVTLSLFVKPPHTRLSCITRIVPSPGWFVGLSGIELCPMEQDASVQTIFSLPGWNSGLYKNDVYRGKPLRSLKPPAPISQLLLSIESYGTAVIGESDGPSLPEESNGSTLPVANDDPSLQGENGPGASPATGENELGPSPTMEEEEGEVMNEDENEDGSACFPNGEIVELESAEKVPIETLDVENVVMSKGVNVYSQVFMFSHREPDTISTFVQLRFRTAESKGRIRLSPGHYIYTFRFSEGCDEPKSLCEDSVVLHMARHVRKGDFLVGIDGSPREVCSVEYVRARGLWNPHTMDGDLVVSGVRVSAFTTAVEPGLANALLAPVRGLHRLGWRVVSNWLSYHVLSGFWNERLCRLFLF